MKTVEVFMYGWPELRGTVEVDGDDCAHCRFVHEHVRFEPGDVVFVCQGDHIRRVEGAFGFLGRTAMLCERVTSEQVDRELVESKNTVSRRCH